jgi:Co/Zn/Cd efflux system component
MACCGGGCAEAQREDDRRFRRVLWIALGINATMFLTELIAGAAAGSVSLQADAMDFLADAANYAVSLVVLTAFPAWRSHAALVKGLSLGTLGLWVAGQTAWNALAQSVPEAEVMSVVGALALTANLGCAALLYVHRRGDANRRSVWICSRNDALANLAVLAAAAGVFGTGTGWPDVAVASVMAALSVWGAAQIVGQALEEIRITARTMPRTAVRPR